MITEDYVSYEVAKLLKEKGFGIEEETRGYYPTKGDALGRLMFGAEYHHNTSQVQIAAPTHQMAMKWLREVHYKYIEIYTDREQHNFKDIVFRPEIYDNDFDCLWTGNRFFTYEEAVEAALKYCLENLI